MTLGRIDFSSRTSDSDVAETDVIYRELSLPSGGYQYQPVKPSTLLHVLPLLTSATLSFNRTTTNPNQCLHLVLTYPPGPQYPLNPNGVDACVATALSQVRVSGFDNRFPKKGFRTMQQGVWLEAYPLYEGYTWGLFGVTMTQVDEVVKKNGFWRCDWEVSRVMEGGKLGRIYGRGHLWPNLVRGGYEGAVGEIMTESV
ncbi:MAG: hypothetical protein Q9204_001272 [Flavoplaca sp. TL-2023a]